MIPTIDEPPLAANDDCVFDTGPRHKRRSLFDRPPAPSVGTYYRRIPDGTPVRLVFTEEDGAGIPMRAGRRHPTRDERQDATEGTPLEREFRDGRLPEFLRHAADVIAELHERAALPASACRSPSLADEGDEPAFGSDEWKKQPNQSYLLQGYDITAVVPDAASEAERVPVKSIRATPPADQLCGVEIRVRAAQVLAFVRYRCAHLWRDLIDAVVLGRSMRDIGVRHGGNANDAAKLGREKVRDALTLAHDALADLLRWEKADTNALTGAAPIVPRIAKAIGQNVDVPQKWHVAANDDLRAVKVA